MKKDRAANIDEYVSGFPEDVQEKLQAIRTTIRQAAPDAEETINYAVPTYKLNGTLRCAKPKLGRSQGFIKHKTSIEDLTEMHTSEDNSIAGPRPA